jgi:hypothetical protein
MVADDSDEFNREERMKRGIEQKETKETKGIEE